MPSDFANPSPPSEDRRWRLVEATMRRHGRQSHALIESLHTVPEAFGYLELEALRYVAAALRVPLSQIFGVATFYHFFNLKPQGEHTCVVCLGTACYIKGAANIVAAIEQAAHVKAGETTADGQLSLLSARCVGSCGLAPAVVFDGEVVGKVGVPEVLERLGGGHAMMLEELARVAVSEQESQAHFQHRVHVCVAASYPAVLTPFGRHA